jgi:hypothetical protein
MEEKMNEEISTEELSQHNNFLLNAVIDVLVDKKVFSEEELEAKVKSLAADVKEE